MLVVEWWTFARETGLTREALGKDGGHAGTDETACLLATRPNLVKRGLYDGGEIAVYRRGVKAYPYLGSIINYSEEEGDVVFDEEKARDFFDRLVGAIAEEFSEFRRRAGRLQ